MTRPIDQILHRNWKILSECQQTAGTRKFFVNRAKLNKRGFHTGYFTSSMVNSDGKKYHYIYDYAWMEFSEKEVMVVKLDKPK